MRIFALGDPHLSLDKKGQINKPMDIFGEHWKAHHEKIKQNWEAIVTHEDVVLVPGDLSWALKLEDASYDLEFLGGLPGMKILIKGNHDLWWQSISKVRKNLPDKMYALQNDHIILPNNIAICGTRGWICPGDKYFNTEEDTKIYERELIRLRLSLDSIKGDVDEIIVMLHYPPTNGKHEMSGFVDILQQYKIKKCVYAHLHSDSINGAISGIKWGINFYLVSADAIDFTPLLIESKRVVKS
jgi:hypothetical protein